MSYKKISKTLTFFLILSVLFFTSHIFCYASTAKTYDVGKQDVKITKSGNYILTGSTKEHTVTISKGVKATITLKNVSITNSKEVDSIDIKSGATVTLILTGTNTIENTFYNTAIHVPYGAKLTISDKSKGSLKASAGYKGAAIGGSVSASKAGTGTIIINGGTIEAIGDESCCGIGGGGFDYLWGIDEDEYLGGGDITINGGTVTAIGGPYSVAGIGGASIVRQGKITINGGTVTAFSGQAGIGGEYIKGKGNLISITGGTVTAKGNNYAAAIGNNVNPKGTIVSITGGMIAAKGDYGDRMLYEGTSTSSNFLKSLKAFDIAAEKIVIDGGNFDAYTFTSQPVNKEGNPVYLTILNIEKKGNIKITMNKKTYGSKDIISNGYLSLYLPTGNSPLRISSGKTILFEDYVWPYANPIENGVKVKNFTADLGKGDLVLIGDGCIFNNQVYQYDTITVTGTTTNHQILVHQSVHPVQTLIFKNLTVNYTKKDSKDFLVIDNDVSLTIHLQGKNKINLGDQVRGMFVGHDATLRFTGWDTTDQLLVTTGVNTNAIYTNMGNVELSGGSLTFQLGNNSTAIYTGNFGTFTQCNGTFEAHGDNTSCISGANNFLVNIYGGTLIADTLGMYENGNEEATNKTKFTMTGGKVIISNRLIFSDYHLYGGDLSAKILGCGTGCQVIMVNGTLEIGTFVNYTYDSEFHEVIVRDIKTENIYGGTIIQRDDVPEEEIKKISFGTC